MLVPLLTLACNRHDECHRYRENYNRCMEEHGEPLDAKDPKEPCKASEYDYYCWAEAFADSCETDTGYQEALSEFRVCYEESEG